MVTERFIYHDMKAKLLQWDSKYLWNGVIHEGVKPEEVKQEQYRSAQDCKQESDLHYIVPFFAP